ncbi:MAG: hypothetical protein AB8G95_26315 [Anaerolineae bacterium]
MGNKTTLQIGQKIEIEANNVIPISWLPLFSASDLEKEDKGEDGMSITLKVSKETALTRIFQFSDFLEMYESYSTYFRPIEILQAEISKLESQETITLDLSSFWKVSKSYANNIILNLQHFSDVIVGDRHFDAPELTVLVNRFTLYSIEDVETLDAHTKMLVFFGTYWGDSEKEDLYSERYFGPAYWGSAAESAEVTQEGEFGVESLSLFESIRNFLDLQD